MKYKKLTYFFKVRENAILIFFAILLLIIIIRLFFIQILQAWYYKKLLFYQHFRMYSLVPSRGNIYISHGSWSVIPLTQNITLFNIYVDPKFIPDKSKLIDILTPFIYKHLCVIHWIDEVENKKECIENIEKYTWKKLLPKIEQFNLLSGENSKISYIKYKEDIKKIIENFDTWYAYSLIKERLNSLIKTGYREYNYLGFFSDNKVITQLKALNFVKVIDNWYVYVKPSLIQDPDRAKERLKDILNSNWYYIDDSKLEYVVYRRPIRYIVIARNVYPEYVMKLREIKRKLYTKKINWIPLLHGLGFEKTEKRFYPLWTFLANVIWYLWDDWRWHYWLEEYYDQILRWRPWKVYWLVAHWIWWLTNRWITVTPPQNWKDIYLTIDFDLQKKLESILKKYYKELKADSVSAIIIDPNTGYIKAMANWPTFDPNFYRQVYKLQPLTYDKEYIINDDTYIDIPVFVETGWVLKVATLAERKDPYLKKYIFKNLLWPQVFVDKNISMAYEPWSVFKTFTLAIWIDTKSINLYDFYFDKWFVKVWPYKIKNVAKECKWEHTFLHALERSCNVWMVKIAERMKRRVYYNYLKRLWFGKVTWIELAKEDPGDIPALKRFSMARFFNNTFGQWILVTPIQLAVWYSAMVNWGYLIKPTIVEKIYDPNTKQWFYNKPQIIDRIFSSWTSQNIKFALYSVIAEWDLPMLAISGYTLWGKTWTSQIAFKWKYQRGVWWTNWSFVWIVTKDDLKYVIVVQVRRPRTCQWWVCSAWKIFKEIAKYIIESWRVVK